MMTDLPAMAAALDLPDVGRRHRIGELLAVVLADSLAGVATGRRVRRELRALASAELLLAGLRADIDAVGGAVEETHGSREGF